MRFVQCSCGFDEESGENSLLFSLLAVNLTRMVFQSGPDREALAKLL